MKKNIILLAGGRGTRISRLIKNVPKCTLPICETTLIRRTVKMLLRKDFNVIVCTGYKQELVKKALDGLDVKYYHNPFYGVTNSIGTLWFALEEIKGDTYIMNADVFLDEKIIDDLILTTNDATLSSDKSRVAVGDYFFQTTDNLIKKYGKELQLEERTEEYVGVAKINSSFVDTFKERIVKLVVEDGDFNLWWENALYSLADDGVKINALDVDNKFWGEVDFYDDYERILKYIKENNIQVQY